MNDPDYNNEEHTGPVRTDPLIIAEFLLLFIGAPILFFFNIVAIPKIPTILAVSAYAFYHLMTDPSFERNRLIDTSKFKKRMGGIVVRLFFVCAALITAARVITPETFFNFPEITLQWAGLLLVYAVFSAIPQEIVYRAFFFHRYRGIFPGRMSMVLASTVLFSYMHIAYRNWVAVGITLVGGILFSMSYDKTKSLPFASIEHGLYGCACFIIGFRHFFV
jgi:membrane protease YdiL (CAAX protease family)